MDINVNAIADTLNHKVDLPDGKNQSDIDYVVAFQRPTASNNYTWYRKYKSGWVEQGGITESSSGSAAKNITFPITMANTNYTPTVTLIAGLPYSSAGNNFGVKNNNTTTGMVVYTGNTAAASWQVSGMAAA